MLNPASSTLSLQGAAWGTAPAVVAGLGILIVCIATFRLALTPIWQHAAEASGLSMRGMASATHSSDLAPSRKQPRIDPSV